MTILVIDQEIARMIMEYQNFLPVKLTAILFFLAFLEPIILVAQNFWYMISEIEFEEKKKASNHGVKKSLADFVVHYKGLPTKEFLEEVNGSPKVLKEIGDKLEKIGVLIRGDKNARVLSTTLSESKVRDLIKFNIV